MGASPETVTAFVAQGPYLSHPGKLVVVLHEIDREVAPSPVLRRESDPPVALANLDYLDLLARLERQVFFFLAIEVVFCCERAKPWLIS